MELAICGGFFVIYLLEELVHTFVGHHHPEDEDQRSDKDSLATASPPATYSPTSIHRLKNNLALEHNALPSPANLLTCNKRNDSDDSLEKGYINYGIDLKAESPIGAPPTLFPFYHTQSCDALVIPGSESPKIVSNQADKPLLPASVRFARGLVTIAAFSAHSIFDGVAIGLQESTSQIWTMFFAICVHKLVVAFAVGMELFEQTSSLTMTTIQMTLFALMSPIGIFIVMMTERTMNEADSPVIILLSAVATGTILYIVFFEILQRDRTKDGSKAMGFILFIAMITGFTVMVCVTIFIVH